MDRNEVLKKVAYLTDNINKKVRAFRENGNGKFYENNLNYVTSKFDRKINLTMESGFLTKSKQELGKLSTKELNQLYNNLRNLQTNEKYGTVKRFKTYEKVQLSKTASTIKNMIGEERFNALMNGKSETEMVKEFIKRKEEMNNGRGATYSSNQILNNMLLDVPQTEEEQQDIQRAINKMERARELMQRNSIDMESRRKNGNRN